MTGTATLRPSKMPRIPFDRIIVCTITFKSGLILRSLSNMRRTKGRNYFYRALQEQLLEQMAKEDQQCLRDLRLIDPRDEIKTIEDRKDPLFKGSYAWIFDCKEYKKFMNWEDGNKHRLLWIKGDAGKGKTMLLLGVIRELEQLKLNPYSPSLSYFFCQGTSSMLNTHSFIHSLFHYPHVRAEPV
jgi:NACHT domain